MSKSINDLAALFPGTSVAELPAFLSILLDMERLRQPTPRICITSRLEGMLCEPVLTPAKRYDVFPESESV